jgi:hypothetical protein
MSARLYDRPDLDQRRRAPALYVDGSLPTAKPSIAYEGRLQIHNAIGACTVSQIAGSALPPGSQVYVDQANSQVVVAWPAYNSSVTPLTNPGFESGNLGGWNVTLTGQQSVPPKTIEVSSGRPHSGSYGAHYVGEQGIGHAGGIEAVWENGTEGVCYPMQRVTANAFVALDDTSQSQNRGRVRLNWYDASGTLVGTSDGDLIRGNDSSYRQSQVRGLAPAAAKKCKLAVWVTANYSGGVRFDDVSWDLPSVIGINYSATLSLSLLVTDSAGRSFIWNGQIIVTPVYWDGTWNYFNRSPVDWWYSIYYVDDWDLWVGFALNELYTSVDGVSWNLRYSLNGGAYMTNGAFAYSHALGRLIVVYNGALGYISNKNTMAITTGTGYGAGGGAIGSALWVEYLQKFFCSSRDGCNRSSDGAAWLYSAYPNSQYTNAYRLAWDDFNKKLVLPCQNGVTYSSVDGITWTAVGTHPFTSNSTTKSTFYSANLKALIFIVQQGLSVASLYISYDGGANWTPFLPYSSSTQSTSGIFAESEDIGDFVVAYAAGKWGRYKDGTWTFGTYVTTSGNSPCIAYSKKLGYYLVMLSNPGGTPGIAKSNSSA